MTPEDLAQARAAAADDLAAIHALSDAERAEFGEWVDAPDPATDGLECDHGAGLAAELRDVADG